mgnify:CR=1 FL=1
MFKKARYLTGFFILYANFPVSKTHDIKFWVNDNLQQIENNLEDDVALTSLINIKNWSEGEFNKKYSDLQNRKDNGFIRECHGDMHLGNMVLIEDKVTIFDGIEFNNHLRWIDVISEVAFVMMDLVMPNYDGFYGIEKIRKYNPKSKIMIISASLTPSYVKRLLDLNVDSISLKPYDLSNVIETIQKIENGIEVQKVPNIFQRQLNQ